MEFCFSGKEGEAFSKNKSAGKYPTLLNRLMPMQIGLGKDYIR